MPTPPRSLLVAVALAAVVSLPVLAGCGKKDTASASAKAEAGAPKPVSRVVEAEAEGHVSDAAFAVQIKDWARAEASLTKAVKLRDDIPEWWVTLGSMQRRLGKTSEAKGSYKKALSLHELRYDKAGDIDALLEQVFVLVLLGREKDARSTLESALKKHPDNQQLKQFNSAKTIDRMLADKQVAEIGVK